MLRKDIILKLEKKIKENDSYFSYSTTKDLYNASKKYLSEELSTIAYQLYSFDIKPEREEYVLDDELKKIGTGKKYFLKNMGFLYR